MMMSALCRLPCMKCASYSGSVDISDICQHCLLRSSSTTPAPSLGVPKHHVSTDINSHPHKYTPAGAYAPYTEGASSSVPQLGHVSTYICQLATRKQSKW